MYLGENIDNNIVSNESVVELKNFTKLVKSLEIQTLLNNANDDKNVILTIHPGAGGKDSQDWAFMLYRMYIKWAENNNYKYNILSYNEGDETGIKDVSIEINADLIMKGTKVDGVYDSDPEKNKSARRYNSLTYKEVIDNELKIMDLTAITMCKENNFPIVVFNLKEEDSINSVLENSSFGTIIN